MKLEVLVADDQNKDYLESFQRAFNGKANFTAVPNGGSAFMTFQEKPCHVLLIEYCVPGGAFQTVFKIKSKADNRLKVIGYNRSTEKENMWDQEDKESLGISLVTGSTVQVARYLARMVGIDEQAYQRDIKPYFEGTQG